ncbi:MerR family DNA-binding transcriptional regulator [Nocardiopsis sp. CNR-923]|uniref:MerR family DNA-binding transcriptional regulator n=1 Tax=Nocardiopsis sp. CNR-923 TaxID=1904965 RepID=UPI00117D4075|nr:MerR family DNA-binding transcriptional regulator [Nocardiopsis sp. CNR-923]
MRLGALARCMGVSPGALRQRERQGLLTFTRTPGGHREYGPIAHERVATSIDQLQRSLTVLDTVIDGARRDDSPEWAAAGSGTPRGGGRPVSLTARATRQAKSRTTSATRRRP